MLLTSVGFCVAVQVANEMMLERIRVNERATIRLIELRYLAARLYALSGSEITVFVIWLPHIMSCFCHIVLQLTVSMCRGHLYVKFLIALLRSNSCSVDLKAVAAREVISLHRVDL